MSDDVNEAGESREERAARKRREYRQANAEQLREYKRAWIAANPEKHNKHSRDYAERQRRKDAQRAKDRERAREWAKKNPERVKQRNAEWVASNAEKRREIDRNSYYRNREKRLAAMRERNAERRRDPARAALQEQYRKSNREHLNELQRQRRARDPEASRADQRERRQREKRRIELGLPKVTRHRTLKNERAENERQAAEFFARRRHAAATRELDREAGAVTLIAERTHGRELMAAEDLANRVLSGYVAHKAVPPLIDVEVEKILATGIREELRMDLIARHARGGPPVDVDREIRRMATRQVITNLSDKIGIPIFIPQEARLQPSSREETRQSLASRIDSAVAIAKRSASSRTRRDTGRSPEGR